MFRAISAILLGFLFLFLSSCGQEISKSLNYYEMSDSQRDRLTGVYQVTDGNPQLPTGTSYIIVHNSDTRTNEMGGTFLFLTRESGGKYVVSKVVTHPAGKFENDYLKLDDGTRAIKKSLNDLPMDSTIKNAAKLSVVASSLQSQLHKSSIEVKLFDTGSRTLNVSDEQIAVVTKMLDNVDTVSDFAKRNNVVGIYIDNDSTSKTYPIFLENIGADKVLRICSQSLHAYPDGTEVLEKLKQNRL